MERVHTMNPFVRRENHPASSIWIYRTLTILTWLILLCYTLFCTFDARAIGNTRTIWAQNEAHATPFSLDPITTSIYWFALLAFQAGYIYSLFKSNGEYVNTAANVGSHFIINNILQTTFFGLWTHASFRFGELILILNFLNLTSLYFRHLKTPRHIHVPVVSGPLAFTFVSLFWNGAAMVDGKSQTARVFANIAIWGILSYGLFFLAVFNDYSMGWELSVLSLALAVHQLSVKVLATQWIFAFIVMSLLVACSLALTLLNFAGKELRFIGEADLARQIRDLEDPERESLLGSE